MSGPENNFISSVHTYLPPMNVLYRMKNNNVYNAGIADMWYSGNKADLWIEYKFITIPKRTGKIDLIGGKNPPLSHLQQNWLKLRFKEGRNVAVIVGSKDGGVFMDLLEWTEPWTPDEFKSMLKTRKELAEIIQRRTLITP